MTVTLIPDVHAERASESSFGPPRPTALPVTVVRHGTVVALRQRGAIALGSLTDRAAAEGHRLVTAHDAAGQGWWISAHAVWSDADASGHPERPLPIGLATAATRDAALIAGLSDRLGWEAVLEFERGTDLPRAEALADFADDNVVFLDGRLGHDVPTVVVLGRDMVRWGAATTWYGAMRRAMYGDDGNPDPGRELPELCTLLARSGLGVAAVDLDTPLLRRAGIARCSVQIVTV
jgi:hypothetical protein